MAEQFINEQLGKYQLTTSLDATFPWQEFLTIEAQVLGHTGLNEKKAVTNMNPIFNFGEQNILTMAAVSDRLLGCAYVWPRDLTGTQEDFVYVEGPNGLVLTPIDEAIRTQFYSHNMTVLELELGGAIVPLNLQGNRMYSSLFSNRNQFLKNSILNGSIQLCVNTKNPDTNSVYVTLSSKGNLDGHPNVPNLKKKGTITQSDLQENGIPLELIAEPRPESAATKHMAQKMGMQLVGCSSNNFGPVYAIPLTDFLNTNYV